MRDVRVCVGIDLSRRSKHKGVIKRSSSESQPGRKGVFSFSHDMDGFRRLREHILKSTGVRSLEGVSINVEPTSGVWEPVLAIFSKWGAEVYFTRADVVSAIRRAQSKFTKSDRIDAHTLSGMPWSMPERMVRYVSVEPRIRKLRELTAQRQRIVEEVVRWKNRLIAKLEPLWQPLLVMLKKEQRFSRLLRAFFKKFPVPSALMTYGRKRFDSWFDKHAHLNTEPELRDLLWEGAEKSAEIENELKELYPDKEFFAMLYAQHLRIIETLEQELQYIEQEIDKAREDVPECDVVQQIPGIGKVIAPSITALLMPVERFSNAKKCGNYTGFTSRQKSSSGRETLGLRITKAGNPRLKRDLALAGDVAMRIDPQLALFALRLLERGKHYNKVRVAVGRKCAIRAYSLLKRIARGEQNVTYVFRDLQGNAISREQARSIAQTIWAVYDIRNQKNKSAKTRFIRGSQKTPHSGSSGLSLTDTIAQYTCGIQEKSPTNAQKKYTQHYRALVENLCKKIPKNT